MSIYKRIISFILVLLIVISMSSALPVVSAQSSSTTTVGATIEITATVNYKWAFEVLRLINEIRAEEGLHPYEMNRQMLEDAMQRSAELAVNYSHMRPDGTPCLDINYDTYAENIAVLYGSPKQVVNGWMNSPRHAANIMSKSFEKIGIGIVIHNDIPCWTQLFGLSDSENAATLDEVYEKDFSIYLGENVYEMEIVTPDLCFVNDSEKIQVRGKNLNGGGLYFFVKPETVSMESDNPTVATFSGNTLTCHSEGKATITAENSAFSLSKEIEIKEFAPGKSRKCGDNITWDYSNGTLTLTGFGRMYDYNTETDIYKEVTTDVPWEDGIEKINKVIVGEGITYIGKTAFARFIALTETELPKSLGEIGNYAFSGCTELSAITLPQGVSHLGEGVFYGCCNTFTINLPQGLTHIGAYAFSMCECLSSITLPDTVTYIGTGAFDSCSGLEEITIPEGVVNIPAEAFYFCPNLKSVSIPESVETIRDYAFYGCKRLENVVLPDSLTYIGNSAFAGCLAINSITIPKRVDRLYKSVFAGCTNLEEITIENPCITFGSDDMFSFLGENLTVYGYKNSSADKYCNQNGLNFVPFELSKINAQVKGDSKLYDGLTYVDELHISFETTPDEYIVKYSEGETFDFEKNFDSIEKLAEYYKSLNKKYLTECGTYTISYFIYSTGFEPVTGSADIVIEKVTPRFSFEKAEVEIPYYVNGYNNGVYVNSLVDLGSLKESELEFSSDDTSVASVYKSGIVYAGGVGECTITAKLSEDKNHYPHSVSYKLRVYPVGVLEVGDFAFAFKEDKTATLFDYYGTDSLVTVPTQAMNYNISEIAHGAFFQGAFEEVVIPEGITHIGTSAFASCLNLKKVNLSDTVTTIDESAFNYCKNLENITIPDGVTSIMDKAFAGCNNMSGVEIPSSVTYIGDKAFGYNQYYYSGDTFKNENFIIYGHKDTAAERYAKENGFRFVDLDAPVPVYDLGDVNRDGSVNIKDATAVQKYIADLLEFDDEQKFLADFNEDESVNIKDVTAIQKRVAGLI